MKLINDIFGVWIFAVAFSCAGPLFGQYTDGPTRFMEKTSTGEAHVKTLQLAVIDALTQTKFPEKNWHKIPMTVKQAERIISMRDELDDRLQTEASKYYAQFKKDKLPKGDSLNVAYQLANDARIDWYEEANEELSTLLDAKQIGQLRKMALVELLTHHEDVSSVLKGAGVQDSDWDSRAIAPVVKKYNERLFELRSKFMTDVLAALPKEQREKIEARATIRKLRAPNSK